MIFCVSEETARTVVSLEDAIDQVEAAFASLDREESRLFSGAFGQGSETGTRFGAKLGFDGMSGTPGLKVGTYWPGNRAKGIGAHGSTTLLLDDTTGLPRAVVASTHLTALRTAAANAVAVKHLARADASVLAVFGTGHQAYWEARAVACVRKLDLVLVVGRDLAAATKLADRLAADGVEATAASIEGALGQADIVATVTASRAPLFAAGLARPGVHISAMGADGVGKQELDPALGDRALLFADHPPQSVILGEFQHLSAQAQSRVDSLGALINRKVPGRRAADEITVFDSSGVALQDLVVAELALGRAKAAGLVQTIKLF
jgi:ornithine cyclodeaminase